MILAVELLILCIALMVFMMQHRLKQKISIVGSKLVYWTTLLFASLGLNSILMALYPNSYSLWTYLNRDTFIVIAGMVLGYIVLQIMAPSRVIKKLIKKMNRKKSDSNDGILDEENPESNTYLKELHFETFLETICWLAFIFTLALQGYNTLFKVLPLSQTIDQSFKNIICLMMMVTVPIGIRQIVFYLYRIRGMREEEELAEIEMKFDYKLRKNNHKL